MPTIEERLLALEQNDNSLMELGHRTGIADGGALFAVDFIIFGAIKRALSSAAGFRAMVRERNFTCAAVVLRMNLDTAARLYALTLVASMHDHATAILGGTKLRKLKDRDGKLLHDAYIIEKLSAHYPWAKPVWEKSSAFVHFTEQNIFTTFKRTDDATKEVQLWISKEDEIADASWHELIDAYRESTKLVMLFIEVWRQTKENGGKQRVA